MISLVSDLTFSQYKSLKEVSTFGIGGLAHYYCEVRSVAEMQGAIQQSLQLGLPYLILGKGSNCLFDDKGFAGVVIHNKIDFFHKLHPHFFHVGAGYSFSLLGVQTARQGLTGLEFASGIPGSVGGAVFMNAGANGKETCETLISVDYITEKGNLECLKKEELYFAYRTSSFQKMTGAIAGATFSLHPLAEARQKQLEITKRRIKTQPYSDKSAGCMFRNPSCQSAGALIEQSHLKGLSVGGAKVSELHANFIINTGEASSQDVLALIQLIREQVKKQTGKELESEVRFIPYNGETHG